jgi:hypothetical protein
MAVRARSLVALSLLMLAPVLVLSLPDMGSAAPASATNPVARSTGGVRNVTFYYGGNTRLRAGSALSALGHPSIVVTTPKGGADADAVAAIHSMKAKAYRYVQLFWAPGDADYDGINLRAHPGWVFCGPRGTKAIGRSTGGGAHPWYFLDANEKSLRTRVRALMAKYKAQGWDGVMFDRGQAATQYAKDIHGNPIWDRRSTCTYDAYKPGARFADAFVNLLGLAHAAGLQAMMNNGSSPFDPVTRMRPDPRNVSCQRARWSKCRFLSDVWSKVNLVLNESATRPRDVLWRRTFVANERSERSGPEGRRTVALITTGSLGGAANQTRSHVFYAWSRVKLFDLAVSVNTGDGGCGDAGSDAVCNRYGVYPQLVDTVMGQTVSSRPTSQSCARRSKINCVWVRRYRQGTTVLNARPVAVRDVRVDLGLANCRYVYDVYRRAPLAGNACKQAVRMDLPSWSGRPLRLSTKPW